MKFLASFQPLFLLLLLSALIAACDSGPSNDEPPPQNTPEPRVVADADYTVTDSGLKYFDFEIGTGAKAETGDIIFVHYHGWLTNGQLFDSSYLQQEPYSFVMGLGDVIPGWEEGILNMRVGGERQLVIPPDLAYGAAGRGPIPPQRHHHLRNRSDRRNGSLSRALDAAKRRRTSDSPPGQEGCPEGTGWSIENR